MSPLWLFALAVFFGYLARDAWQFRRSSRHQVWAVPPVSGRAVGEDPLSRWEQDLSRSHKFTGADGFPGLHWIFVLMALVCAGSGVHLWLVG